MCPAESEGGTTPNDDPDERRAAGGDGLDRLVGDSAMNAPESAITIFAKLQLWRRKNMHLGRSKL